MSADKDRGIRRTKQKRAKQLKREAKQQSQDQRKAASGAPTQQAG